jgi:hypothetical protein
MHEVLISYSKTDKKWADAACSVLEARSIRCWIAPRDVMPGTEWGAAIIAGIDACKIMVLIFSSSANESPQVRREVERAISKGLSVVPCRVEDVRPVGAMEYALGNTHWLDVFTPPVERQMNRLAESVEALLPRDREASSGAGGPSVASDSKGRTENLREKNIPLWNWQGKPAALAACGFMLFVLFAVGLTVVLWPRKDAASTLKNITGPDTVGAGQSPPTSVGRLDPHPVVVVPTRNADDSFVSLFNGKDLIGWERRGNAKVQWRVKNGILNGSWPPRTDNAGGSTLDSTRSDYQNFRFRIETKLSRHWSTRMGFLYQLDPATQRASGGYQALIGAPGGPDVAKTAVLWGLGKTPVAVPNYPVRPDKDEWFWQEVVVEAKHIRIYVNDVLRTEYEEKEPPGPGHIGIHLSGGASISIRKIEIKELSPKRASTAAASADH